MKMTIRTRAVLTLALLLCALAGTALAIDYQSTIRDQASWDNTFFGLMNKNIKIENAQIENRKDVTATYLMISNSTLVNASSGILYFPDIYIDASSTLEAVGTIRSKIACYGELKILDRDACVPILCSIELLSGGTVRNQTSSALNVKIGGQSTSISANSLIMKLGTPANLTWNNRVLSWDAVTGASQYEIEAYQNNTLLNRLTISDNSYDFTELIKNNGAGAYKMKVCALG